MEKFVDFVDLLQMVRTNLYHKPSQFVDFVDLWANKHYRKFWFENLCRLINVDHITIQRFNVNLISINMLINKL